MKIFSAAQIKEWDAFTIINEPISSIDLMERAANAVVIWLLQNGFVEKDLFYIFADKATTAAMVWQ